MDFGNLPLNTKRSYVAARDPSGCEIYIPVDSRNLDIMQSKRFELIAFLNSQFTHAEPMPA